MAKETGDAETVVKQNTRITNIETQKAAALAKGDFQTHRELSIAAGDAQMTITFLAGSEGRKGHG